MLEHKFVTNFSLIQRYMYGNLYVSVMFAFVHLLMYVCYTRISEFALTAGCY
jgi:hypothetical protein